MNRRNDPLSRKISSMYQLSKGSDVRGDVLLFSRRSKNRGLGSVVEDVQCFFEFY